MKIKSRDELGKLFEAHKVTGFGAEVGVKEGWNALNIINHYTGRLFLVDNWEMFDYQICQGLLKSNELRVTYMFMTSLKAAEEIPDETLDFVYIDADHAYESVKADYEAWYPKVRKGGIMSGHDYSMAFPGVVRFVNELMQEEEIFFTDGDVWEGIPYESWYHFKQ